jgi:hypothetical protein
LVATGRSGVGHLRRLSHVAAALRRTGSSHITLVTNASALDLAWFQDAPFDTIAHAERDAIARRLVAAEPEIVIVDTAVIPDIERVDARRVLLLRACRDVARFSTPVPWNDVLIPHPPYEWHPSISDSFAETVTWVGWVHGHPRRLVRDHPAGRDRRVIVAFGGGGAMSRDDSMRARVWSVIEQLRSIAGVKVSLLVGPRSGEAGPEAVDDRLPAQDDPRSVYAAADLVVSTAGYNSVLELAGIDTPILFAPAARTHDDQDARARSWATSLGHGLDDVDSAVRWGRRVLESGARRDPVDLPVCGSGRIASVVLGTGSS